MLLETKGIRKQFNGSYALDGVDFSVSEGEVHGLVGENGAGKSTLIKLLTGVYQLEEGEVFFKGTPLNCHNPGKVREAGICAIHQDFQLVPSFSCLENIFLEMEYPRKGFFVDWKKMKKMAEKTMLELGIELDLDQNTDELTPPQKTCLEIVRAMMQECRLLILDEPTASLTDRECEILFRLIAKLKEQGCSIIYISHRMDEIFRLTDRITVMKNGKISGVLCTADTNQDEIISLMTDEWKAAAQESYEAGDVILKVEHLSTKDGKVKDVSFQAKCGEIFGIFGLGGSGRTELLEAIYGYRTSSGGRVYLNGESYDKRTCAASVQKGLCLICEDRRGKAMVGDMSNEDNILLSTLEQYASYGILNTKEARKEAESFKEALTIRMASMNQPVKELSGGNQQKVVFARAMTTAPKIWLCDEPTQAVDIATRGEIHHFMRQEAKKGCSVIYVTSDLKEMLDIADRILVLAEGKDRGILENQDLTSIQVLEICYNKENEKG